MRHKRKAIANPCNVFWASHGCRKQRGHLGRHLCNPGCPHPDGYQLYGLGGINISEPDERKVDQ